MSRVKCVEYRLRHDAATDLRWRFLIRHDASDLADGRKLEVKGGALPDTLRLALQGLADDTAVEMGWEFFEFEGDDSGVSVFWVEFGGAKMVQRLVQHLRRLSRAMHEA